ncbi:glycoside hydrolase family 97 protein [Bacteroides uniformis]|uniref:glycoside hydrolase family 97 protein n=1 Tax=Bacteroides uniformis TaxID=820 RepID=UPI000ED5DDBC|nr:glycoside hydrolase family 97 protein [Bacteroides uniformis]MDC1998249.1 glycoside hydrolase family 97 protein [Bacteroides uniformis]MDC2002013.1 glycoside hydrolase family 97 protein [Bacteroides uniformis]MDC2005757.1 glycoside hydrolase family 97 protein [Bacteroides uniformis]HCR03160.1 alpha-glucosidase [Bacteroides uniformis]
MKNRLKLLVWLFALSGPLAAQSVSVNGPDGKLQLTVSCPSANGEVSYAVTYNGKQMLESSPLGMETNVGDFYRGLQLKEHKVTALDTVYEQSRIKASHIHYRANELLCSFVNGEGKNVQITFRVSNNDVAFRYTLPREQGKGSVMVNSERTGFRFPSQTTTFLCPQSDAMIGWKRTKPSYEEEYKADAPMNERSGYGHGYTFPCLFKVGDDGWVLLSETGVDSRYCGSRLSDWDNGVYRIAFPMPEENNGNGTVSPAFSLPGSTPWRTVTVGETLKPIVETTVPWDVVEPRYTTTHDYKPGRGTWSWILWQDGSINYDDQVRYVDLAAAMGYEYVLIDNWWDNNIGRDRMEQFVKYARSKGVEVFLWYSSSGYWNDIEQSPVNRMDNSIARKQEMRWLQSLGVKGIKVDFFGGDKQETLRLYEEILSDADDHGLMVIFHGCTLPRGWERMYPNYVGSEAVLASENLVFSQHFCDNEAFNATLHPFIRNAVGCMEFGGVFLNKCLNRSNDGGTIRRTTDIFQLATAVLFQNPIQNFALAPNNLTDAPQICLDFMKQVPTTWDETRFIDGYPGRYIVLARRHGNTWYIAAANATAEPLKLKLDLPMLAGQEVSLYSDDKKMQPQLKLQKIKTDGSLQLTVQPQGGAVIVK